MSLSLRMNNRTLKSFTRCAYTKGSSERRAVFKVVDISKCTIIVLPQRFKEKEYKLLLFNFNVSVLITLK